MTQTAPSYRCGLPLAGTIYTCNQPVGHGGVHVYGWRPENPDPADYVCTEPDGHTGPHRHARQTAAVIADDATLAAALLAQAREVKRLTNAHERALDEQMNAEGKARDVYDALLAAREVLHLMQRDLPLPDGDQ